MALCVSWEQLRVVIQAVAMSTWGERNVHLTTLICVQMLLAVQMARITAALIHRVPVQDSAHVVVLP